MEPTAYWRTRSNGVIARSYFPAATKVEVYIDGEWVERPLFLDLAEDVDWERITAEEAEAATT